MTIFQYIPHVNHNDDDWENFDKFLNFFFEEALKTVPKLGTTTQKHLLGSNSYHTNSGKFKHVQRPTVLSCHWKFYKILVAFSNFRLCLVLTGLLVKS